MKERRSPKAKDIENNDKENGGDEWERKKRGHGKPKGHDDGSDDESAYSDAGLDTIKRGEPLERPGFCGNLCSGRLLDGKTKSSLCPNSRTRQ